MPRPSHLTTIALVAAALYLYALASDNTLLALLAKPIPVLALIAWLRSAPATPYRRWITLGLAALGAGLFVCSDSLIGIDRFVSPFAAAPYLIILTYWLGQWAIASSASRRPIGKVLTQSGASGVGSC